MTQEERIRFALFCANQYAGIDGSHHKMWVIDQMVRSLTGCPDVIKKATTHDGVEYKYEALGESEEYLEFVRQHNEGEDGPDTYEWDEGIPP